MLGLLDGMGGLVASSQGKPFVTTPQLIVGLLLVGGGLATIGRLALHFSGG